MQRHQIILSFIVAIGVFSLIAPKMLGTIFPAISLILFLVFGGTDKKSLKNPFFLFCSTILILSVSSLLWTVDLSLSLERVWKISLVLLGGICFQQLIVKHVLSNVDGNFIPNNVLRVAVFAFSCVGLMFIFEIMSDGVVYKLTHAHEIEEEGYSLSRYNLQVLLMFLMFIPLVFYTIKFKHYRSLTALLASVLPLLLLSENQTVHLALLMFVLSMGTIVMLKQYSRWIFIICGFCLFGALPFIAIEVYSNDIIVESDLFQLMQKSSPLQQMELWANASIEVLKMPFLGHGIDTISFHKFDMGDKYFTTPYTPHTHNNFLQIWYDFGVLGVLAIMPFLFYPILRLKRDCSIETIVSVSFYISILSILSIAYSIWQAWFVGALIYTYGISIILLKQECKSDAPSSQKN